MGLTKRRLMAMEADLNRELRLCAVCDERVEYEGAGKSWQVELSFTGRNPELCLITDPRLIAYIDSHPEEVYSLTPRQFEELIAELLSKMGYKVRLGP